MWGKTSSHQKTYRNVLVAKKIEILLTSITFEKPSFIVSRVSLLDHVLPDKDINHNFSTCHFSISMI